MLHFNIPKITLRRVNFQDDKRNFIMFEIGSDWHHPNFGIGTVLRTSAHSVDLKFLTDCRRITNTRSLQKVYQCKVCGVSAPEFFDLARALVCSGSLIMCEECYTKQLADWGRRSAIRGSVDENDRILRSCCECKKKLIWDEIRYGEGKEKCNDCFYAPPLPWWKRKVAALSGPEIRGGPGV